MNQGGQYALLENNDHLGITVAFYAIRWPSWTYLNRLKDAKAATCQGDDGWPP